MFFLMLFLPALFSIAHISASNTSTPPVRWEYEFDTTIPIELNKLGLVGISNIASPSAFSHFGNGLLEKPVQVRYKDRIPKKITTYRLPRLIDQEDLSQIKKTLHSYVPETVELAESAVVIPGRLEQRDPKKYLTLCIDVMIQIMQYVKREIDSGAKNRTGQVLRYLSALHTNNNPALYQPQMPLTYNDVEPILTLKRNLENIIRISNYWSATDHGLREVPDTCARLYTVRDCNRTHTESTLTAIQNINTAITATQTYKELKNRLHILNSALQSAEFKKLEKKHEITKTTFECDRIILDAAIPNYILRKAPYSLKVSHALSESENGLRRLADLFNREKKQIEEYTQLSYHPNPFINSYQSAPLLEQAETIGLLIALLPLTDPADLPTTQLYNEVTIISFWSDLIKECSDNTASNIVEKLTNKKCKSRQEAANILQSRKRTIMPNSPRILLESDIVYNWTTRCKIV